MDKERRDNVIPISRRNEEQYDSIVEKKGGIKSINYQEIRGFYREIERIEVHDLPLSTFSLMYGSEDEEEDIQLIYERISRTKKILGTKEKDARFLFDVALDLLSKDYKIGSNLIENVLVKVYRGMNLMVDLAIDHILIEDELNAAKLLNDVLDINPYHEAAYHELAGLLFEMNGMESSRATIKRGLAYLDSPMLKRFDLVLDMDEYSFFREERNFKRENMFPYYKNLRRKFNSVIREEYNSDLVLSFAVFQMSEQYYSDSIKTLRMLDKRFKTLKKEYDTIDDYVWAYNYFKFNALNYNELDTFVCYKIMGQLKDFFTDLLFYDVSVDRLAASF